MGLRERDVIWQQLPKMLPRPQAQKRTLKMRRLLVFKSATRFGILVSRRFVFMICLPPVVQYCVRNPGWKLVCTAWRYSPSYTLGRMLWLHMYRGDG